jgi:hypothetical protein
MGSDGGSAVCGKEFDPEGVCESYSAWSKGNKCKETSS